MPWSAEEVLDGQRERVDVRSSIPQLLTMTSRRKDQKTMFADWSLIVPLRTPSVKGLN